MRTIRDERGAVSLWVVMGLSVILMVLGYMVDGGGQIAAQERAQNVAELSARAGAQRVDASTVRGGAAKVDGRLAVGTAKAHMAKAGMQGDAWIENGNTLVVRTRATYETKMLGLIGITTLEASGESRAVLIAVKDGVEG